MSGIRVTTLRSRFTRFSVIIASVVAIIVILGNSFNFLALKQYDRAFYRYDKLAEFYAYVASMHSSLMNHLYSNEPEELRRYEACKGQALAAIEDLKLFSGEELRFRYELLANMVETYSERYERMSQGTNGRTTQAWYDNLSRLNDLILDTYSHYSSLTTNEMQSERVLLTEKWRNQLFLSVLILLLTIVTAFVFSISAIRTITEPIDAMVGNINKLKKGDFAISRTFAGCQEISILVQAFSDMAVEISDHIEELKEKNTIEKRLMETENENLKIGRDLAQARFSALQQQMNPHFLFNTLSTLSKLAYIEGAEQSSELMVKTANVLRYSLEMGDKISSIGAEAQCVENYFEIQKKRIGDRVNFHLSLDRELENVPIPGMLLQPLVENCVIHGVKDSMGDAIIRVDIIRKDQRALITIEDNGIGIPADRIAKLRNRAPMDGAGVTNFGISNVVQRLDICYRGDFHFSIESEESCGTLVSIDIPIVSEIGHDPLVDS